MSKQNDCALNSSFQGLSLGSISAWYKKTLDGLGPEPSFIVTPMVFSQRLAQGELYTHSVFMQLYQRLYKFFGPDQSWRNQKQFLTLKGMQQEFSMPLRGDARRYKSGAFGTTRTTRRQCLNHAQPSECDHRALRQTAAPDTCQNAKQ